MRSVFSGNTKDTGAHEPYLVRATHAQKLERYIGRDQLERISQGMLRGGSDGGRYHGPPIPIAGVPGRVYACADGDFCGPIKGGYFGNLTDYAVSRYKRASREALRRSHGTLNTGFASFSDFISEMTVGGKKQVIPYNKVGVAQPAIGNNAVLHRQGIQPSAGAAAAAPVAGTAFTKASAGALGPQVNASVANASDTLHFVNWIGQQTTAQTTTLMLYDYLYAANFNYNSAVAQPVTGVPTRYQTAALSPGNTLTGNVTTLLGATPANVTMTYVDDAGDAAEAGTAQAVRISSAVDTMPFTAPAWFYTLNAGDRGLRNLTNFILSAAMGAGAVDRMIIHPLVFMPGIGVANQGYFVDGVNSAANFERIYDDACLGLMEHQKSATAANTYMGSITLCGG